jgi:formamidopyrimidine-DNA glycosylase
MHHLRMTGSFGTRPEITKPSHVRMEYETARGIVWYRDPRRFGTLELFEQPSQGEEYLARRLGPEPLGPDFTPSWLRAALQRRNAPIKAVLLDQRVGTGLGNIYVDEALFLSRIHPNAPASSLSAAAVRRLHAAIVARLTEAIEAGGSTLRDYRGVAGESGGMQERFLVYGRGGEPCPNCGRPLVTGRVAGRGTTWCSRCQRYRSPGNTGTNAGRNRT